LAPVSSVDINGCSRDWRVVRPNVIVRVAALALFALAPWAVGAGSAVSSRAAHPVEAMPSECEEQNSPSLDEPSVDTDAGRPITEKVALPTGDEDDQDDQDGGFCRSETLELWSQQEPMPVRQALNIATRANS
jgi:hypothetical protein